MDDRSLTRVGGGGATFAPTSFGELERLAKYAVDSRLFGVANEGAAVIVLLTGASLHLDPITALRGVHVVQGKAVLSSDLLVAVVLASGQCVRWTPVEVTAERCVIETLRRGHASPVRHTWTMVDARRAGLDGKSTWKQFPGAMLRARCSAELARMVYADTLFGVYVEGEIDDPREPAHVVETIAPAVVTAAPPKARVPPRERRDATPPPSATAAVVETLPAPVVVEAPADDHPEPVDPEAEAFERHRLAQERAAQEPRPSWLDGGPSALVEHLAGMSTWQHVEASARLHGRHFSDTTRHAYIDRFFDLQQRAYGGRARTREAIVAHIGRCIAEGPKPARAEVA